GVDELAGLAGLAQPEVVVVDELGGGEAVVELDEVEILGPDTGRLVGPVGGQAGEGVDVGLDLAAVDERIAGEHRGGDLDRPAADLVGQGGQAFAAGDHDGGGAVAGGAAHERRVGPGDH